MKKENNQNNFFKWIVKNPVFWILLVFSFFWAEWGISFSYNLILLIVGICSWIFLFFIYFSITERGNYEERLKLKIKVLTIIIILLYILITSIEKGLNP
jgi:hypothetical protein